MYFSIKYLIKNMKRLCRPYMLNEKRNYSLYLFIKGLIVISLLTMLLCQYKKLYKELYFLGLIKISF